mgnify:CR=1 FL=1|tara:strand:- start:47840 stop:49840 length:2001 start_codon:yes stop_codon:yes gene_type:complete
MTELVDTNMPSAKNYRILKEQFNLKSEVFLIFAAKDSNLPLEEINNWSEQILREDYSVNRIVSAFNFVYPETSFQRITYKKLIRPENGISDLEKLYTSPWNNLLTSNRNLDFALELHLDPMENEKFGEFNPKAIKSIRKSLSETFSQISSIKFVGPGAFTFFAFEGIQFNFKLNLIFLIILFVVFRVLFGTWKSGSFFIISLLWSGLLLHGMMAKFQFPMEILSSGLFTMIAVASIEDYFYLCHQGLKGNDISRSVKNLFIPSLFTSLTTVIGFGSLLFSDIEIVGRFGLWASIGAILEWMATFFLLPALLKIFKVKSLVNPEKSFISSSKRWSQYIQKFTPKKKVAYSFFIIYPISILILLNLKVSDNPLSLFPKDHQINKDFQYLKATRNWEGQASIVFNENLEEEIKEEVYRKLKEIENIEKIERLDNILEFYTTGENQRYKDAIEIDIRTSDIKDRYMTEFFQERYLLYFKNTEFYFFTNTKKKIESICKNNCKLIGEIIAYSEFMEKVPLGLIKSLGTSLLLVSLLILFLAWLYKVTNPIMFVLSSLWGPSSLLILMGIFEIQINFLSCVFVTMMVGLTGDNGIQMIFAHQNKDNKNGSHGILEHQDCAIQMGILLSFSCLMFMASYFAPPREFGPIMAIGFAFSLFGDVCLTRAFSLKKS